MNDQEYAEYQMQKINAEGSPQVKFFDVTGKSTNYMTLKNGAIIKARSVTYPRIALPNQSA